MPRLRHFDHDGRIRFVTFSCHRRLPVLFTDPLRAIVARAIGEARQHYHFRILGYVIMPEHVHLVILPGAGTELGRLIGEIKQESAKRISPMLERLRSPLLHSLHVVRDHTTKRVVWLKRCFDHNCRDQATVQDKIEYCHFNPVKRGLVVEPGAWVFSSYSWYGGCRNVPLTIDELETSAQGPTLRVGH